MFFFNVQDCCPLFFLISGECVLTNKVMCHGELIVLIHLQFMILIYENLRNIDALSESVPTKILLG